MGNSNPCTALYTVYIVVKTIIISVDSAIHENEKYEISFTAKYDITENLLCVAYVRSAYFNTWSSILVQSPPRRASVKD